MKKNVSQSAFTKRVLGVVRRIPRGSVMTYGQVAEVVGVYGAARAVGSIMKQNTDPLVPCHRVIRADGDVGEYNGRQGVGRTARHKKIGLLQKEGVRVSATGKILKKERHMIY